MKLYYVLAAVLVTVSHVAREGKSAEPPAADKLNILLILADDLGWTALGSYGQKDVATPNLDRLAREGMRFTDAYADSQCSPTRAALLSGQYGARTGVHKVIHERDPRNPPMLAPEANLALSPQLGNLAQTLRRVGYATGISGKWHVADGYDAAPLRQLNGGAYFDAYGFDFVGEAKPGKEPDKHIDAITSDLLGFIDKNKSRPFFAYFAHHATHTPMEAPEGLIQKYVAKGYKKSTSPVAKVEERPTADYLAMIDHLDASVGKVLTKLEELKLTDRTVVMFYADNGGLGRMADQAPLRESKGSPYKGGIRVPLIVRWPGVVRPGSVCDVPVHAVDFYPTVTAVAGAQAPKGHTLDGLSMVPLLKGAGTLDRPALFWHMPTYTAMYGRTPCAVIRKGDWKLIHFFGDYLDTRGRLPSNRGLYGNLVLGERTELYNLKHDLSEQDDLACQNPKKAAELMADLQAWFVETGAKLPSANPQFDLADKDWWVNTPNKPAKGNRGANE